MITIHYPLGEMPIGNVIFISYELKRLFCLEHEQLVVLNGADLRSHLLDPDQGTRARAAALAAGPDAATITLHLLDVADALLDDLFIRINRIVIRAVPAFHFDDFPLAYQAGIDRWGARQNTIQRLLAGELRWIRGGYGLPYIEERLESDW